MGSGPFEVPKPPVFYTEALGEQICARIAEGETLSQICRSEGMPHLRTVYSWLAESKEGGSIPVAFATAYERARQDQFQVREDELVDIADDARNDWMDRETQNGTIRVVDHEHIQRSKLRIDARLWLLSKLQPHKYGDRIAVQALDEHGKPARAGITVIVDGAPASGEPK